MINTGCRDWRGWRAEGGLGAAGKLLPPQIHNDYSPRINKQIIYEYRPPK